MLIEIVDCQRTVMKSAIAEIFGPIKIRSCKKMKIKGVKALVVAGVIAVTAMTSGCSTLGEKALSSEELKAQDQTLWTYYPQASYALNINRYVNPTARIQDTEVPKEQFDHLQDFIGTTGTAMTLGDMAMGTTSLFEGAMALTLFLRDPNEQAKTVYVGAFEEDKGYKNWAEAAEAFCLDILKDMKETAEAQGIKITYHGYNQARLYDDSKWSPIVFKGVKKVDVDGKEKELEITISWVMPKTDAARTEPVKLPKWLDEKERLIWPMRNIGGTTYFLSPSLFSYEQIKKTELFELNFFKELAKRSPENRYFYLPTYSTPEVRTPPMIMDKNRQMFFVKVKKDDH